MKLLSPIRFRLSTISNDTFNHKASISDAAAMLQVRNRNERDVRAQPKNTAKVFHLLDSVG
jgi:hypothetical protein